MEVLAIFVSMDTYNENEEPRTVTSSEIDILNVPEDSELWNILKVDSEYPKELHDKQSISFSTSACSGQR